MCYKVFDKVSNKNVNILHHVVIIGHCTSVLINLLKKKGT